MLLVWSVNVHYAPLFLAGGCGACVHYLYHNGDEEARGTGAFYRLLQRTPGAQRGVRSVPIRKASVGQGLITDAEWDTLRKPLESSVRVLTLVPVDVAVKAITIFGETDRSAKLIEALGYDRPSEWRRGSGRCPV